MQILVKRYWRTLAGQSEAVVYDVYKELHLRIARALQVRHMRCLLQFAFSDSCRQANFTEKEGLEVALADWEADMAKMPEGAPMQFSMFFGECVGPAVGHSQVLIHAWP